jgi:DNA-binding GntR family transcriptional regulator
MSEEQRFTRLEQRLDVIEHTLNDYSKANLKDKFELKELIRNAVSDGNEKILAVIERHETRIAALENKDGEKAKTIIKTILTTSLTWLILGLLTNLPAILRVLENK